MHELHKVTWHTKLLAVWFLVIFAPILFFCLGVQYGQLQTFSKQPVYSSPEAKVFEIKTVSAPVSENLMYFKPATSIKNVAGSYSNIIGYFGSGDFFFYVPAWIPEHWEIQKIAHGGMKFVLNKDIEGKDFSDIVIELATTTEKVNAETLYSQTIASDDTALCIGGSRCEVRDIDSSILTSEVFLSRVGDTRIYHVVKAMPDDTIRDYFYIDGRKSTATITFSAEKNVYTQYTGFIRDFVQGIGKGEAPRG